MMSKQKNLIAIIKEKALIRGPVQLASGQKSDFYIDLSKITFDAYGIGLISSLVIEEVKSWRSIQTVGGPAYGAIPIVSGVLTLLNESHWAMNGFFFRKEIKPHGKAELIEGHLNQGDKVILVEDITTTGNSLMKVVEEVKKIAEIVQIISIVDRNQGAHKLFANQNLFFKSILTVDQILY